jgi:hypothetical protein
VYVGALKFLYQIVLEQPDVMALVPRRKQPIRLPVLLGAADIVRLLAAIPSITVTHHLDAGLRRRSARQRSLRRARRGRRQPADGCCA